MKIKEFVKEVITEIVQGVIDASNELKDVDVLINPRTHQSYDMIYDTAEVEKVRRVQQVEFDISVSVDDKTEDRKGISVVAGVLGMGAASKEANQNASYHKVKFSVPLSLPVTKKENSF